MNSSELSAEEVAAAHAAGSAATGQFRMTLAALVEETASVDALEVLARAGLSVLLRSPNPTKRIGKASMELFHLELIQALALSRQRATAHPETDYPDVTQRVIDLIGQNAQAYRDQAKSKISFDVAANRRQEMLALIQSWKLAVRGARQGFQTRDFATDLARSVNSSFRHHYGCDATEVVAALSAVIDICQRRVQTYLHDLRSWMSKKTGISMVEAFIHQFTPERKAEIAPQAMHFRYDRRQLEAFLWNLNEQRLRSLFTFTADELVATAPIEQRESLIAVIAHLSLGFGTVTSAELEHLHLDNPVQLKPLIQLDDRTFFCAGPQILGIHLAEIVEALCATKPKLKKASEKARADWLEARLSAMVRKFLPHADVRENVKWSDNDGVTTWESDLVAVIDKNVLVFEAKSAKISAAARRGALQSLKDALQELVIAPSDQSLRLKQRILATKGPTTFDTRQGPLVINPDEVRDIVRINIVQDVVGPLSSHWPQLKSVGLIPFDKDIAPSMSIFDLETVFELISLEIERCHYLSRRAELERNAVYTADELDLLAVYLRNRFNIGEDEHDGSHLTWYGESIRLTPMPDERRGMQLVAPPSTTTPFWTKLLAALDERRPTGWTRFGHRLLNVDVANQRRIERLMKKGLKEVMRRPDLFFQTGITMGTTKKLHTIAIAVGAPVSRDQFESNLMSCAESAFEQGGQEDILVLYWFVPRSSEPYDFVGVFRRRRHQEFGGQLFWPTV